MTKNTNDKIFDLEDRTTVFSERIIVLCKSLRLTNILIPLINQLIRSATSIGANYREANGASSKKDFKNKIYLCKKESKETQYWLQLLAKALNNGPMEECRILWKEAHELTLIFSSIALRTK